MTNSSMPLKSGLPSIRNSQSVIRNRWLHIRSDQRLQQQLELADLDLAVEGVLDAVDDGDGQRAFVAVALEHGDDPGVIDLSLADADLELAGSQARIAEVDVVDVGEDGVEVDVRCVRP